MKRRTVNTLLASQAATAWLAGCGGGGNDSSSTNNSPNASKSTAAAAALAPSAPPAPRKLLQFGWDAPTAAYYRAHLQAFEEGLFDGISIVMGYEVGDAVFTRVQLPDAPFEQSRKDLKASPSSRMTDNLLWMWSTFRGEFDWFSDADWAIAETNIRNFAKTAQAGGLKGIVFDSEDYPGYRFVDGQLGIGAWGYVDQVQHRNKSFTEFQAQVRLRGAQYMAVIQQEFPGLLLFLLHSVSGNWELLHAASDAERQKLMKDDRRWGLWYSFFNGMLDAVEPATTIIDGNEGSYYYRDEWYFDYSRIEFSESALAVVDPANHATYRRRMRLGEAAFVDGCLNLKDLINPSLYFGYWISSDERRLKFMEYNIYHALRTTDRYVWFWNQNMDWWGTRGDGVVVPDGLEDAIVSAQTNYYKGRPAGIMPADFRPVPAASGSARNLLVNPGFESGRYEPWNYDAQGAVVKRPRSGTFAFRAGSGHRVWQVVENLKPRTVYTVRLWTGGGKGTAIAKPLNESWSFQAFKKQADYAPVELTFLTDETSLPVTVEVQSESPDVPVWVDDAELMEGRGD